MSRHVRWLPAAALALGAAAQSANYPAPSYVLSTDPAWPTAADWAQLNASVGGRLAALRPWGAVCFTQDPLFDDAACQQVLTHYTNNTYREEFASPLLWANWQECPADDGCALDSLDPQVVSDRTCAQGTTPPYSVTALSASDVAAAVQWATPRNVKLVVKNTGHDYQGRSAGPSNLQLWTHAMDDLAFDPAFVPQGSSADPVPAITFGAGVQSEQLYAFAGEHNVTVPLGGCLSVGSAGGYLQGGGHGPMAPVLGLAADSALQFEVVTADGEVRTVNEAQDPDLFWALRGGGAGSFGVVTSATLATSPAVPYSYSLLTVVPAAGLNASTEAVAFLTFLGEYANGWLEDGMSFVGFVMSNAYIVHLYWPSPSAPLAALYPFYAALDAQSARWAVAANETAYDAFPSVSAAMLAQIGPFFDSIESYGGAVRFASRLVPHTALADPAARAQVAQAMWDGHDVLNAPLQTGEARSLPESPISILGDMPYATRARANATGANPALYAATWHVMYSTFYPSNFSADTAAAINAAIHAATQPLTDVGVTGSYQNEGDAYEEDWQEAFFGYKYPQLLSIKQKYDPTNYFSTWKGVGFVEDLDVWQCYIDGTPAPVAARRAPAGGSLHDEL